MLGLKTSRSGVIHQNSNLSGRRISHSHSEPFEAELCNRPNGRTIAE
jgi:hypothetical protein